MFSDKERDAVKQWYSQPHVLKRAQEISETGALDELEEWVHKFCLMPLSKHDDLPDYMRDGEGKPLFADSLSPIKDKEKWQDAIEVGWTVMEEEIGVSLDDVHRFEAKFQKDDWQAFLDSIERRKKERGEA